MNVPPIIFLNGTNPPAFPGFQNTRFQTDNGFPLESISSCVPKTGLAIVQTGSYTAQDVDCGSLQVFNSTTPANFLLPGTVPFLKWCIFVANIGSGPVTISSGLPIDGVNGLIVLNTGQGTYIAGANDGSGYYTDGGLGATSQGGGSAILFVDNEKLSGTYDGANPTYTVSRQPSPVGSLEIFAKGAALYSDVDYALNGSTVTFLQNIPDSSYLNKLRAWYRYLPQGSGSTYTITFQNATSVPFVHNLNTFNLMPGVWDTNGNQIPYGTFRLTSLNAALLTFPTPQSGTLTLTPTVFQQLFSNQSAVTITHNLASTNIIWVVYDSVFNVLFPDNVQILDPNTCVVTFADPQSGNFQIMSPAGAYSQTFTNAGNVTPIAVAHNLGQRLLKAVAYDASGGSVPFNTFGPVDTNNSSLTFSKPQTGNVVVAIP